MKKKRLIAVTIMALAVAMLGGCGNKNMDPITTEASTEALPQTATDASSVDESTQAAGATTEAKSEADTFASNRSAAEKNVIEYVGEGFKIVSSESLPSNEDTDVFKIGVTSTTGDDAPIWYYYASKDFCKSEKQWLAASDDTKQSGDGQNPLMNFIGNYSNGRARMTIECDGNTGARIYVVWSGSATESSEWSMSGDFTEEDGKFVITYSNCVETDYVYATDGSVTSTKVAYENGSGTVTIATEDSTITWKDDMFPSSTDYDFHPEEE